MIFNHPNDTTILSLNRHKPGMSSNDLAKIILTLDNTFPIGIDNTFVTITDDTTSFMEVPRFYYPFLLGQGREVSVVQDGRFFIRWDRAKQQHRISSTPTAVSMSLRALLQQEWSMCYDKSAFELDTLFAGIVYANYVADSIMRLFALPLNQKTSLLVPIFDFWYSLHRDHNHRESNGDELAVMANSLLVPYDVVSELISDLPVPCNVHDLIANIKQCNNDPRLSALTLPAFTSAVNNGWMMDNSRELLMVAMEHPPTWAAIAYVAATEKLFKRSAVASTTTQYGRSRKTSFINYINDLISRKTRLKELMLV